MVRPLLSPNRLWISVEPSESKATGFIIENAPSASTLTASITGGDGIVTLSQVVVEERFFRPMSEEEIRELPPRPPSIREQARRNGQVEEVMEVGRSDGSTPLSVPANARVWFALEIAAPTQIVPDVISATMTVAASGWEMLEAPVHVLIGRASITPEISPAEVGRVVEPGEVSTYSVVIASAPSTTKMVAFVESGENVINVKNMISFHTIYKPFTEEEIQELPPHPPSIREQARRDGYVEHVEAARSLGDRPLPVERGQLVTIDVRFAPPVRDFSLSMSARLVVDSPSWHRLEIPLRLVVGVIHTELSTSQVTARQGGSAELEVTISSLQGPATDVALALGMGDDQWHIEPASMHVPQGRGARQKVQVVVGPQAPVGTFPTGFETRYFEDLAFRSLPFQLTVEAAAVQLRLLQPNIAISQGGRASGQVEVRSEGGYKLFTFRATSLPDGVTMTPVTRELGFGAATVVIALEFAATTSARVIRDDLVNVEWSAGDGTHGGTLPLKLTVNLTPESRTFEQVITTPSGTALGGNVSLTLRNDGTYTYSGHMHGSGFDPYAFRISVVVRARDGVITVAAMKSGKVGGTIGGGSRDFDWTENDHSVALAENWASVRDGQAEFVKWYTDTGVLGTIDDIAKALVNFLVGSVIVGPHVSAAILIGSELGKLTNVPFAHPAGLAGVVVTGATVLVLGPGMLVPALVAGIATGAQVRTRRMRPSEREFADTVFAGTVPFDRILLTNLDRGGRAFCVPHVDGSILIGLGGEEGGVARFDDPLRTEETRRTFIHELTHAWQIVHRTVAAEIFWQATINEAADRRELYDQWERKLDGRAWGDFGLEDQAQIVGYWSWIARAGKLAELMIAGEPVVEPLKLDSAIGLAHRSFPYIQHNIRMGQT